MSASAIERSGWVFPNFPHDLRLKDDGRTYKDSGGTTFHSHHSQRFPNLAKDPWCSTDYHPFLEEEVQEEKSQKKEEAEELGETAFTCGSHEFSAGLLTKSGRAGALKGDDVQFVGPDWASAGV